MVYTRETNSPVLMLHDQESPVGLVFMEPQDELSLHRHDYVELVIITGGEGVHLLRDDAWPIQAGDVFVIPPFMEHGYEQCQDLDLINLCIDAAWCERNQLRSIPGFNAFIALEPLLRTQHDFSSHLHIDDETRLRMMQSIQDMRRELEEQLPGYQQSIRHRLDLLLIECAREHSQHSSHQHDALLQLEDVLRYIDTNYATSINLEQLSNKAAMSVSTLNRYFQRCFSCSPMHYLLQRRLRRAQELLQSTEKRVSDIAKEVGINDSNYFARVYKKYFKHSPKADRKLSNG